jgi:antitoxin FitA
MPTITVKNIPNDLYARLKRLATMHHRSLSREVIACIEHALHRRRISPEIALARATTARDDTPIHNQ